MDYYSAHVIARLEHEHRIRSLPKITEFGYPHVVSQHVWLRQKIQHWLHQQSSRLVAVAKRILQEPATSKSREQREGEVQA